MLTTQFQQWIKDKVGSDITAKSRFVFRFTGKSTVGEVVSDVTIDLVWYILIQIEDDDAIKLDVVLALLQEQEYLDVFKRTLAAQSAKRPIAEFLIFNPMFLDGLKQHVDFSLLNDPVDFITYALFINFGAEVDTLDIYIKRIEIIQAVLTTDFILQSDSPVRKENIVIRKLLYMEGTEDRYANIQRLLKMGYALFGPNATINAEMAVEIIIQRENASCMAIIQENIPLFKAIRLHVAGTDDGQGNLTDFFYWAKEDMDAVHFMKTVMGLELTQ